MKGSYINKTEESFRQFAIKKGWHITKRGWPDFIVFDKNWNPLGVVEVKVKKSHKKYIENTLICNISRKQLKKNKRLKYQKLIRSFLINNGINVKVWTPNDDFDF